MRLNLNLPRIYIQVKTKLSGQHNIHIYVAWPTTYVIRKRSPRWRVTAGQLERILAEFNNGIQFQSILEIKVIVNKFNFPVAIAYILAFCIFFMKFPFPKVKAWVSISLKWIPREFAYYVNWKETNQDQIQLVKYSNKLVLHWSQWVGRMDR